MAMTGMDVVLACSREPGFVEMFDRLTGHNLSEIGKRAPLDAMIDEATGRDAEAFEAFIDFVYEVVVSRLPQDP